MVPWTPFNRWKGPPIASLQSDTGKEGSPADLSRYLRSLWAARQRIYQRSVAFSTPRHTRRTTGDRPPFTWKLLANDMMSLEAGSLIPCRVSCGLQRLCKKQTGVWKVFLIFHESTFCFFFQEWTCWGSGHRRFTWESLPKLSKAKEIRKTLTVFSNSTEMPEHLVYEQVSFSIVNTCETYYK